MSIINQLDEHLTNMIAAGEVVERPAGIVKELIENSLDAKSKHIKINIKQGGIELIQIIDDGIGMDERDVSLAFERHATSKISEIDDLWNIKTMGFRGEAIPSIASVSKMILSSNNGETSNTLTVEYGNKKEIKPTSLPKGTQIDVINLFQKTPARFKHLKSPNYEFTLINEIVEKFALGNADVSFTLTSDDKTIFYSLGNGKIDQILMSIYSRDIAVGCRKISSSDNDYNLDGYTVIPSFARANKYHMYLYINNRMVKNYHLQKAIIDAYSQYLPNDRFPICVLNINMDSKLVDVNVHPSKWEIRLSKEKQLNDLVKQTIKQILENEMGVNEVKANKPLEKIEEQVLSFESISDDVNLAIMENDYKYADNSSSNLSTNNILNMNETIEEQMIPYKSEFEIKDKYEEHNYENKETNSKVIQETTSNQKLEEKTKQNESKNSSFPQMKVLSQLSGRYILAQGDEGLYIIDQHAAQERYHYEYIQNKIENTVYDVQPLLVPVCINATSNACLNITEINEKLAFANITLEVFGDNKLILREIPSWMINYDVNVFIQDLIDLYLKNFEIEIDALRKHTIATLACHSSIRFNRYLNLDEMNKILKDLMYCKQPFHCPHGRPTFILLSHKTLEKDFYRLG